jgi:phosphoserine phosphatase
MRLAREEEWSDDALETLEAVLGKAKRSNKERTIILDFDNTCLEGDCGALIHVHLSRQLRWAFDDGFTDQIPASIGGPTIRELWNEYKASEGQPESRKKLAHALYRELVLIFPRHLSEYGPESTYRWATSLYTGISVDDMQTLAREMIALEGSHPMRKETIEPPNEGDPKISIHRGLRKRPAVRELIEHFDQTELRTHIVSASNEWTVREASRWTGVPSARVHGNRATGEEGFITATPVEPITWGHGKVVVAEGLSQDPPLLAVGDSRTDKELLDFAEHAILVDRGDAELAEYGRSKGWAITSPGALRSEPLGDE